VSTAPTLFARPETVEAVERARAVVVLIGSYDGSGNFGDIAQLAAAQALVERLGPGLLPLPLLEREYLASHDRLIDEGRVHRLPHTLYFDPGNDGDDELLPVPAPVELAFGACYLYGGGYLNRLWGARKLAMLAAAETLLAGGGLTAPCRLATGLQVEAGWVAAGHAAPLAGFELLGSRDGDSRLALESLGTAAALDSGDDAVGLLGRLPVAAPPAADDGPLRLNLHFAEHGWVSERPGVVLGFYAGFLAELADRAGRPLLAQPLIAYLDGRVDERAGVERLRAACGPLAIEIAEPLLLRPANLAEAAPRLRAASLTLSCSYHVALTSLMLEVPAVLIGDNRYYEQKAAGLRADFGLSPAFAPTAGADPAAIAGEVATTLLDPAGGDALRRQLRTGAERLRSRRAATETELLGRLGGGAALALAGRVGEQAERLRLHAAEPAELRARLAVLETEREEQPRAGAEAAVEAELRARQAEAALAGVLQSRSWRLLAPLRRLKALLRRS
jgi:hypothetical protein